MDQLELGLVQRLPERIDRSEGKAAAGMYRQTGGFVENQKILGLQQHRLGGGRGERVRHLRRASGSRPHGRYAHLLAFDELARRLHPAAVHPDLTTAN